MRAEERVFINLKNEIIKLQICSFAPHYIPEKYRPQWLYDELQRLQGPLLDVKSMESVK